MLLPLVDDPGVEATQHLVRLYTAAAPSQIFRLSSTLGAMSAGAYVVDNEGVRELTEAVGAYVSAFKAPRS